jgi:hypothetical protein
MKRVRPRNRRTAPNLIVKLLMALGVAISGTASAQQVPTTGTTNPSDGKTTEFSWEGLTWRMPERFFRGFRPAAYDSKELLIQFGWEKNSDTFAPVDAYPDDMKFSVHVRNVEVEDPRNALALIHRINLPFEKVPLFSAGKFNGMTYIGSSSSIHYFVLEHEDAYVSCMLMKADRLMPPQVAPDVLSKKFRCDTTFRLSIDSYAWVTNSGVYLDDVGSSFISAHREILSFTKRI